MLYIKDSKGIGDAKRGLLLVKKNHNLRTYIALRRGI